MFLSSRTRHALVLAVAITATATIVACDSPTQPTLQVTPWRPNATIQGDTSQCTHGWDIVQGWYHCL